MPTESASSDFGSRGESASGPSPELQREPQLELSPSMLQLGRTLHGDVTAFAVAAAILRSHGEYADRRAAAFIVGPQPAGLAELGVTQWLHEVRTLFEPDTYPDN